MTKGISVIAIGFVLVVTLSSANPTTVGHVAKMTAVLAGTVSAAAQDLETQDIILSANGAAGSQDWEYNAAYDQGWVQHTIQWQPKGRVAKVQWRCVDSCGSRGDEYKFQYRVKLDNGRIVLVMRATTKERGLMRVQLTALTN
ncbi:MAG: hypothetical protein HYR56_20440 [Acidobacteria bacterium]|nr:hypothetical protein [Acidobacteriota bacterium]MBI3423274.1 hypothetical protein [Acidobacteriota bacterium]